MKTKKTDKSRLALELDGAVSLLEYDKKGRLVSREPIDGKLVLKTLICVLEQALDRFERTEVSGPPPEELEKQIKKSLERCLGCCVACGEQCSNRRPEEQPHFCMRDECRCRKHR